jgi:cytochrome c oxidase subunit 4
MSDDGHHIIPKKVLFRVFGALVVLTVVTVAVAQVDLGPLTVPVAIGVATMKALLVVLYFMALKYDSGVNALVFSVGTLFVVVFLVFTLFDTAFRGDLGNVGQQTIRQEEAELQRLREREPSPEQLRVAPGDYPSEGAGADTTSADTTSAAAPGGEQ